MLREKPVKNLVNDYVKSLRQTLHHRKLSTKALHISFAKFSAKILTNFSQYVWSKFPANKNLDFLHRRLSAENKSGYGEGSDFASRTCFRISFRFKMLTPPICFEVSATFLRKKTRETAGFSSRSML